MYQIGIALSHSSRKAPSSFCFCDGFDLSVKHGIESFWEELHPGITSLVEHFNWCWVGRITDLECANSGEAAFSHVRESIIEFLANLMRSEEVKGYGKSIFFISDWPEDGNIRYGEGSVNDVNGYLRLFNGWDELVYRSKLRSFQQGDESPFLVKLINDV